MKFVHLGTLACKLRAYERTCVTIHDLGVASSSHHVFHPIVFVCNKPIHVLYFIYIYVFILYFNIFTKRLITLLIITDIRQKYIAFTLLFCTCEHSHIQYNNRIHIQPTVFRNTLRHNMPLKHGR